MITNKIKISNGCCNGEYVKEYNIYRVPVSNEKISEQDAKRFFKRIEKEIPDNEVILSRDAFLNWDKTEASFRINTKNKKLLELQEKFKKDLKEYEPDVCSINPENGWVTLELFRFSYGKADILKVERILGATDFVIDSDGMDGWLIKYKLGDIL